MAEIIVPIFAANPRNHSYTKLPAKDTEQVDKDTIVALQYISQQRL